MIDYIKGQIIELNPASLVLECSGIGYNILISLQTFEVLQNQEKAVVYIHHYMTEDNELYYGFATKDERELFRLLISVSGIGVNTARMMLSSLTSQEIRNAILSEDIIRSCSGRKRILPRTKQRPPLSCWDFPRRTSTRFFRKSCRRTRRQRSRKSLRLPCRCCSYLPK